MLNIYFLNFINKKGNQIIMLKLGDLITKSFKMAMLILTCFVIDI